MSLVVRLLVRLFFLGTVTWAYFNGPHCWRSLRVQGLVWGVALTFLLGRFFCDSICPLGILQSLVNWIFHPRSHVRRVCTRLPETRTQRIVRWTICAVFFLGLLLGVGAVTMIVPISIYGKAVTLWTPGLVVFGLVVLLSVFGQGRVWCNWICPFGTVFNLVAKIALKKDKVGGGCGNCRKCFEKPEAKAKDEGEQRSAAALSRRETLKGVAVLAVTEKVTDGGLAPVSMPGVPERETDVLPPGAGDRRTFARTCMACQLCVANCPGHCLKPSTKLRTFGQPVMDFQKGYCLPTCVKCTEVCPEHALQFLQRELRLNVHMGCAVWTKDRCVRTTNGDSCTACIRKCPVQAIHLVKGFPVVDRDKCIGCGACEHVCPSRPLPAIYVKGYEMQKTVKPMSEADLVAEMKARIAAGTSVVVARDGVIVAEETGRGIGPLMKLLDENKLLGAIVVDKVVGRAAAAICAQGGAKKVYGTLCAKGAAELLEKRGIVLVPEKTVDVILNRKKTDSCPMEKAVRGLDDPKTMVNAIRKVLKK